LRSTAEACGASFAIRASYSDARSNSLYWVKGLACLARQRQRSACSFRVAKSITFEVAGAFPNTITLHLNSFLPVPFSELRVPFRSRMAACAAVSFARALFGGKETTMPTYRAYLINADNRVASYRPIDAETDAEALTAARQFLNGCDVEVWDLDRRIGRLEHARK
jgi:hypothetical protein